MKKNLYFLPLAAVTLLLFSFFAPQSAEFRWKKTTIDLGKIKLHKMQTVEFEFTNVGSSPLIITQAEGSCGCTNVIFPRNPIMPGESDYIQATYNAEELGTFNKSIKITANTNPSNIAVYIKGEVIE